MALILEAVFSACQPTGGMSRPNRVCPKAGLHSHSHLADRLNGLFGRLPQWVANPLLIAAMGCVNPWLIAAMGCFK